MNDYQYGRVQDAFDEVINAAQDLILADCVTVYGIDGGYFGVEVTFPDGGYSSVDIGDEYDIMAFAEEVGRMMDLNEERDVSREQPFVIYDVASEWA